MLVCTQKQNFTHEIQGLVIVVNQDVTKKQSELRNFYTFEGPLCLAKDIHPCEGLLSLVTLLLGSMDVDGGTLLLGSMTSWIWMKEWILQVPKIGNL